MTKITELGLDDALPGAAFARDLKTQMITGGTEAGVHRFERLPSYEGWAGMCGCGFETSEPSYDSLGPLLKEIREHLERDVFPAVDEAALLKEARFFNIGKLIGYHRLIETTDEHGTRHTGWLIAGVEGTVRVRPDGIGHVQGRWSAFTTETQEG
ncbi:hypothetical protein ACOT81_38830 [Streptomyces sp. WI04-05B]|uniref:Uncharacterized protein n=1 Tax=Streptomyces turgidiscabies (strain Car8) TaxID=698760 RepID=L7F4J4_STRT8|nr:MULTISPECIES: hypothetical protein [Streptomyces]ELP66227.1 hypothetical protein STRTUCAR8_01614 [Streptomyces turgidiscabies Car8]MDX2547555.1 hypothetical protein [Streptomyces sp. WI04-05B]MDX2589948.1 hypothetical protein [Streptomyces sp. WI04-05A]MDX3499821.1 hypothetical protein [Streptomyces turgidiscabies]